jgi:uncharacterized protein (DUF433 family)
VNVYNKAFVRRSGNDRVVDDKIIRINDRKSVRDCGGAARIRDTRIPVWTLVVYRQQGASTEDLLQNYPGLTSQDLQVAWNYYETHQAEIDQWISEDE